MLTKSIILNESLDSWVQSLQSILKSKGETIIYLGMESDDETYTLAEFSQALKIISKTLEGICTATPFYVNVLDDDKKCKDVFGAILLRKKADSIQDLILELRVAVVGNVDSGKSTMLGVLTKGVADDGRGRARVHLFRHPHEAETGRTSSVGMEIMGFDNAGNVVGPGHGHPVLGIPNRTINETISALEGNVISHFAQESSHLRKVGWESVLPESSKFISFIDLAGHEKYLRTTVFGITGHSPEFVMLMVGANAGVVGMTKEHLGLAVALNVPFFIVVTKVDMCPPNVLEETMRQLGKMLKSPGCRKSPVLIKNTRDVTVVSNHFVSERLCPMFHVSNVTGQGLDLLKTFLDLLPRYQSYASNEPTEFQITDTYSVPGVGTVVAGNMTSGTVITGMTLYCGPDEFGNFTPAIVKSIQRRRIPVNETHAGHVSSFALKKIKKNQLRKGMVLLDKQGLPGELPSPLLSDIMTKEISFPSVRFGYVAREFEAEVLVLYHSTTIRTHYQAMVHCGTIRQTASIIDIFCTRSNDSLDSGVSTDEKTVLRTGDRSVVRFKFIKNCEYMQLGKKILFREGRTKGIGKVIRVIS